MVEVVSHIQLYSAKEVLVEAGFDWDNPLRQGVGIKTLRRGRIGDPATGTAPWLEKGKHWVEIAGKTFYTPEGKVFIIQRLQRMQKRRKPGTEEPKSKNQKKRKTNKGKATP